MSAFSGHALSESELTKLKVPELKALCKERGSAVSGNKAALIARLASHTTASPAIQASTVPLSSAPAPPAVSPGVSALVTTAASSVHASFSITAAECATTKTGSFASDRIIPQVSSSRLTGWNAATDPDVTSVTPATRSSLSPAASVTSALPKSSPSIVTLPGRSSLKPSVVCAPISSRRPSQFQALKPQRPIAPPSTIPQVSASQTPIRCIRAARPVHSLQRMKAQYSWILPALGHTAFEDFIPNRVDHDSLLAVMTYLLTRAYSNLAMDGIDSAGNEIPPVLRITTMTCIADGTCRLSFFDDTSHTFVAATGEIISSDDALRPDWTTFTDRLAKSATFHDNSKLMCLVRSQDEEIFEKGISKAFRTRLAIHPDNMLAGELLAIAESYVLANVAPNAISGAWQSVHQQCAEFQGLPSDSKTWYKARQSLAFFLPSAHQVESVTIADLHSSIAIVQTPQRSHFILRLNGQIIGEGDEGILPLFQRLLSCNPQGRTISVSHVSDGQ